ncbi:MAG: acyl-CoA dehydrogenase family protein [Sphingomonadaceae bacterium]
MMEETGIQLGELRESIRQVLDEHHQTRGDDIPGEDGRPLDKALWAQMTELGWFGLGIGEESGGLGLGAAHVAVLHEELGRSLASIPATTTLLAASLITLAGSPQQRADLLPRICRGELMVSMLLPSGYGGAPAYGAEGLSATYEHIPFADSVDLFLLPFTQGDGGLAYAILPAGTPGVVVERRTVIDLTRHLGEVRLSGLDLDHGSIMPVTPEQLAVMRSHADIALASDAIGGAAAIFERTIEYLGVREQFGRPVGSFQALKHRAANWKVLLEASIALARHAADAVASREADAEVLAASAKFYCCDVYASLSGDAIQLHGGIGFTWEHPCHLFLKRAKLNQQMFGGSIEHKERVARLAFNPAAEPAPPSLIRN